MIYEFQATQDLHGYSKPWGPGENVNILHTTPYAGGVYSISPDADISERTDARQTYSIDGNKLTITTQYAFNGIFMATDPLPAGTYTFHGESSDADLRVNTYLCDENFVVLSNTGAWANAGTFNKVITVTDDDSRIVIGFGRSGSGTTVFTNVQVETGSSYTEWSPYENICMPEGFNMWDPENAEYVQLYAGYVNSNTRELLLRPVYTEYNGEELVGPWMSSLDPYDEDTTPTEGAFVIDFGGELTSFEITPFMLQTLLDSLGIRQHFLDGASLLNSLMDQAQGRVRSEDELLNRSRALKVIAIGDQLPAGLKFKPISKDVLPGLPGKFIR